MPRLLTATCLAIVVSLTSLPALAQQPAQHTFRGKVEKVDAAAGMLTVDGENVPGWMMAMTMAYHVENKQVLPTLKAGDYIVATVFDGDMQTLHEVRVDSSRAATASEELPPISYVCESPNETNYIAAEPGKCPQSGADLVPVRLVTAYSCLRVQLPPSDKPGICRYDKTPLVPITVALTFTCKGDPGVDEMEPGTCADGSARIKKYTRRPHGDHNPRHGGLLFMASDQWHHLEGTFVSPNVFRVYFYNDMTQPLGAAGFSARAALANANAEAVGDPVTLATSMDAPANTLSATIPNAKTPTNVKLYVKFNPNDKEQVFDFQFPEYSKEP